MLYKENSIQPSPPPLKEGFGKQNPIFFLNVGPPKEDIFLTTFYGL